MPAVEPTAQTLRNPVLRYALATRPAFLTVTLFAWFVGVGAAYCEGIAIAMGKGLVTLAAALAAHAGINVFNDYYDELNGTDRSNVDRVFPFTGGSRFIQNKVMTARQVRTFGVMLFGVVIAAGIWLMGVSGAGLAGIGAAGLAIGWAYSAPPLVLNSRGFGELCVALGFALIVIGSAYVQRGGFSWMPVIAAVSYALLVTNVLYINQFPDRRADESAGKRHWVVRLGARRARWGYWMIAAVAYGFLVAATAGGGLPSLCLVALLSAVLSGKAGLDLMRFAGEPKRLVAAIKLTIGAAVSHGLLLGLALILARA